MSGSVPPLPNMPSWLGAELKRKAQGQLYLHLYLIKNMFQKKLQTIKSHMLYIMHQFLV
jgi:hypothetical protein